ncbi:unnamed protein product [Cochlearia groenlandica]
MSFVDMIVSSEEDETAPAGAITRARAKEMIKGMQQFAEKTEEEFLSTSSLSSSSPPSSSSLSIPLLPRRVSPFRDPLARSCHVVSEPTLNQG